MSKQRGFLQKNRRVWGILFMLIDAAITFRKPLSDKERLEWVDKFEHYAAQLGNFKGTHCIECGKKIPIEIKRRHPYASFCCYLCNRRVISRRKYQSMKEAKSTKYYAYVRKNTERSKRIRRESGGKKCATCAGVNDNYPDRRTCERCLRKARIR